MQFCVILFILAIPFNFVACQSTNDLPKEIQAKSPLKNLLKNTTSTTELFASNKSNSQTKSDGRSRYSVSKPPSRLTKLAKSLSLGFDPYFSKDYFEPFERRPRPVTLVAFRKNGLVQRYIIKNNDNSIKSLEVAELQSPYNNVGHFWEEEPRDF